MEKWLRDHQDTQTVHGRHSVTIPATDPLTDPESYADPNWGKSQVLVPWRLYRHYCDVRPLKDQYDAMRAWVDFYHSIAEESLIPATYNNWGEHLPLDHVDNPQLMTTCAYYQGTDHLARIANILGRTEDATRYRDRAEEIAVAFNRAFFDSETETYGSGAQTTYALPLSEGIVRDRHEAAVVENLVDQIQKAGTTIQAGYHSVGPLIHSLVDYGYLDLVYELISDPSNPGWVYMSRQGATTMWEYWLADEKPEERVRNHRVLTLVSEWFYRVLAGIEITVPGYETVTVAPKLPTDLECASGTVETPRGTLESSWQRLDSSGDDGNPASLELEATIPWNASGTIRIPTVGVNHVSVREHRTLIWDDSNPGRNQTDAETVKRRLPAGIRDIKRLDDHVSVDVEAGTYSFEVEPLDARRTS